jgi:hypothetical protein
MTLDYPAAHSMDSVWFAVDADGRVTALYTGENGHIPTEGNGGYGFEVLEGLEATFGRPHQDEDFDARSVKLGLFCYDYEDAEFYEDTIGTYYRRAAPAEPAQTDQFPPDVRKRFLPFPKVRFSQADNFQPLEFYPAFEIMNVDACAYLCADGRTVRPIAGQEEAFAEFVKSLRENDPDIVAGFIFDGPTDLPEEG